MTRDIRPPPGVLGPAPRTVSEAAARALAEAEARRLARREATRATEIDGRDGPDPVRYGDWEVKGLACDF